MVPRFEHALEGCEPCCPIGITGLASLQAAPASESKATASSAGFRSNAPSTTPMLDLLRFSSPTIDLPCQDSAPRREPLLDYWERVRSPIFNTTKATKNNEQSTPRPLEMCLIAGVHPHWPSQGQYLGGRIKAIRVLIVQQTRLSRSSPGNKLRRASERPTLDLASLGSAHNSAPPGQKAAEPHAVIRPLPVALTARRSFEPWPAKSPGRRSLSILGASGERRPRC
jgi:hypothetical protein